MYLGQLVDENGDVRRWNLGEVETGRMEAHKPAVDGNSSVFENFVESIQSDERLPSFAVGADYGFDGYCRPACTGRQGGDNFCSGGDRWYSHG